MPDNTINWGQSAVNNSNDWGKAKANSINNFGAVYDSSPSNDTDLTGGPPPYAPFQMQFEVASGVSKTITIPSTKGSSYTVDWGDETTTTESAGDISHTYDGSYPDPTVSIGAEGDSGAFTFFKFGSSASSKGDLLDISQWGSINWSNFVGMFGSCNNPNFQISATDAPNLTNILDSLSYTFYGSTLNSNINHWDVSSITSMFNTFARAYSFNQDLSSWDVSNVTNMQQMFYIATSFNQDISSWDVGNVTNMNQMLRQTSFNQDISGWDVGNVTNMGLMLYRTTPFNQNLSSWALNSSLSNLGAIFASTGMSTANYTDTIVGWAVTVYKNSAPYTVDMGNQLNMEIDRARTSDSASGQTYANKYGSDWTATGWTNAGDARDYLTDSIANGGANWTITGDE